MQDQTCETCRYARRTLHSISCRRYPPTASGWPAVHLYAYPWCGEYEERPEEEQQDKEAE